jgi:hypothetical protein
MEAQKGTNAYASALAWIIANDVDVARLRQRIKNLDNEIRQMESRFPSNCDVESVEMYVTGTLDKDALAFMVALERQSPVIRDYVRMLTRKALLERVVDRKISGIVDAFTAN